MENRSNEAEAPPGATNSRVASRPGAVSSSFSSMSEDERQRRYEAKMREMGQTDACIEKKSEEDGKSPAEASLDSLKRTMSRNQHQRASNIRSVSPEGNAMNRSKSSQPSTNDDTDASSNPPAVKPVNLVEQESQRRFEAKMAEYGQGPKPKEKDEQQPLHPDHEAHMAGKLSGPTQPMYSDKPIEKEGYSQPTQVYGEDNINNKGDTSKNLNYAYFKNNPERMMDGDLAVAMAINEEEEMEKKKDEVIVYAVEYDPDAKPPLHKNRRFQLYGFIGLILIAVIAAGAAIGIGGGGGGETVVVDTLSTPTDAPTIYLTPEEQILYNFLSLHFSPKVRVEGTPHHMAAQWALYEDSYSQSILKDLTTTSSGNLDVRFLQRCVLAFLWFHSTNMGKDPWRSCNPPTFKNMNLDSMVTPSAAGDSVGANGDTCNFLQWNRLGDDSVCFDEVQGVNRWMSSVDTCQWQGVDCSTGTEVLGLDLFWQGLSGTLPSELVALTSLQKISFAYNQFTGTIPSEYARLRTLFALELHGNLLTGSIPSAFYEAASETGALVLLNVGDNQLTGQLDTRLGLMTDLKGLHFFDNKFTGTIPTELGNLRYLSFSRGYGNQLSGSLPTEIGNLRQMNEFWYYQMGLSGPIPSEIGNMSRLQYLRLWGNALSGSIPSEFYSLRKLEQVALQENSLTGTISTAISNMMALEALRVSSNNLNGTIPTELGDLFSLSVAWFHQNNLEGSMPEEVCARGLVGLQADCDPEGVAAVECSCCSSCCEQGLGLGMCFFREGYGEPTLPPNTFENYVMCET